MPRHSRKRGKQVRKMGISKEQVCIATTIDRKGNLIMELACKGRITSNELETLYIEDITSKPKYSSSSRSKRALTDDVIERISQFLKENEQKRLTGLSKQ